MDNVTYINRPFNRSIDGLIGQNCSFVTAGGIFTGTISAVDDNCIYELQDVIFRPAGSFNIQVKMKICEVYGSHIIASLPPMHDLKSEA